MGECSLRGSDMSSRSSIPLCSFMYFFFSSRRRHTRSKRDWSSDVCSSDLARAARGRPDRSGVGACLGYVDLRRMARGVSMSATPQGGGRHRLSRRGLLAGGAAALAAGVVGTPVLAGWRGQSSTGTVLTSRIPLPDPFGWPLTIPPVLTTARSSASADHYEIAQGVSRAELVPGWRSEVWTYGGSFPGPTILSRRRRRVLVTHHNELPVPAVVHLHGGVTPPEHDGYPTDLILPDEHWNDHGHGHHGGDVTVGTRVYEYPNDQRAATLWY